MACLDAFGLRGEGTFAYAGMRQRIKDNQIPVFWEVSWKMAKFAL